MSLGESFGFRNTTGDNVKVIITHLQATVISNIMRMASCVFICSPHKGDHILAHCPSIMDATAKWSPYCTHIAVVHELTRVPMHPPWPSISGTILFKGLSGIILAMLREKKLVLITYFGHFYTRPVLAFRYCRCLRLCVCVSAWPCVCINHGLVRTITHHSFKLESPNLEKRCKRRLQ